MTLPVQMGFSDGVAWDLSKDACQSLAFSKGLADALQPRCTCGRRSFARGKDHGTKRGETPRPETWQGMFLHDAKHRVSQEMLSCDISVYADGIYDARQQAFCSL